MNKRNLSCLSLITAFIIYSMTLSAQTHRKPVRKQHTTTRTVRQIPRSKLKIEYNGFKWYETSKYTNGKQYFGAKDVSGKVIVPCRYRYVYYFSKYFKATTDNDFDALYSLDGDILFPEEMGYNYVGLDDGYYLCIRNNTLDVLNQNKDAIIRNIEGIKFASIPYGGGAIKVENINGKYGMIDFRGNTIVPFKGNDGYNEISTEKDCYLCIADNRLDIVYKKNNTYRRNKTCK